MARRALFALLFEALIVSGAVLGYATSQTASVRAAAQAATPVVASVAAAGAAATPTATPTSSPTATPTATATPTPTPEPTPTATPDPFAVTNSAPVPKCAEGNTPAPTVASDDWSLILVDKTYSVTKDYVPPDLVNVKAAGFGGSYKVRSVMIDDLRQMRIDAGKAGGALAIFSAYRSYSDQISSFRRWMNTLGQAALMSSARPGHSEHQLGLAIDFKEYGGPVPWAYKDWGRMTVAGSWMAKNAWKYGFVQSYPWNKTDQVCYGYEPWHYRYVGRAEAAAIHASGLTPRVWLWKHQPDQTLQATATPAPSPSPTPSPSPAP